MRAQAELMTAIEHAKQAASIVNHPIFIASIKMLRGLTIERFEHLGFEDTLKMQECNVRLNLIEEFEINLSTIIQSGDSAFKSLEEIQTFNQEMKR